eukprot:130556-Rhodomonas_salina.3
MRCRWVSWVTLTFFSASTFSACSRKSTASSVRNRSEPLVVPYATSQYGSTRSLYQRVVPAHTLRGQYGGMRLVSEPSIVCLHVVSPCR